MKQILLLLTIFVVFLSSCADTRYTYQTQLLKPIESNKLEYENDTLHIAFILKPKFIEINILNKTDEGMKINWDEVSFSFDGKTHRTVHKETGTDKVTELQPPTTIPPRSSLRDFILSTDYVTYKQYPGQRVAVQISEMFPDMDWGNKKTKQKILKLKGTKVTIFLPFYMKGQYVSKYYDILITDIVPEIEPGKSKKKK